MNTRDDGQDSGLRDTRLLERLLQAGIVMLDEAQACCLASPAACELLDATDETALRADWDSIRTQLDLPDLSRLRATDRPLQRRVDLRTASGTRLLRYEVHPIEGNDRVPHMMLLRECGLLGPREHALLLASQAYANRHVLTGLVHDAKGPLNNFNLTLALLTSAIARIESSPVPQETLARLGRYLDVLRTETARLSERLTDIHALTQPGAGMHERIDVGVVLRDVVRVLHHQAAMREVTIQLDLPAGPAFVIGDPHQLRLALLSFTTCVLDVTQTGGVVTWRVVAGGYDIGPLLCVNATQAFLPPGLAAEFFRISCLYNSDHAAAITGRMIIEAHGGDVTIESEASPQTGFAIRLRSAPGEKSPVD